MKNRLISKLISALELPPELDLRTPRLVMYGRRELMIENHRGVLRYAGEEARFLTEDGVVSVFGDGMELKEFTPERALLSGRIDGWTYGDRIECGN
ncbi:MAG: YabP/YqfC family sporulation protein [Clostridia bacterium]|nr:YabP/YqfC family sporulation protein [Clostridia bacterium]